MMTERQSVFTFRDYKEFLKLKVSSLEFENRGQRARLAKAINCQASYLTRVLSGDAHLSQEQAEAATRYFVLNRLESAYFISLLNEDRAGTPGLKSHWQNELKRLRRESLDLEKRVPLEQPLTDEQIAVYYSDWYYSAIHVMGSIPRLQRAEAMASALQLPLQTVKEVLGFLCSVKLMQQLDGRFTTGVRQIHLSKNSPFIRQHHANWKLRAITSLSNQQPNDLHYSSVVGISRADFLKIKELIVSCIEQSRNVVRSSAEEVAAVYCFDLFEIDNSEGTL